MKIDDELLMAAKVRVRKKRNDVLDSDILQLISTAISDLKRIGVKGEYLNCQDPLIREAVLTYVNANYGSNPNYDKLNEAYNTLLIKIKGGEYIND